MIEENFKKVQPFESLLQSKKVRYMKEKASGEEKRQRSWSSVSNDKKRVIESAREKDRETGECEEWKTHKGERKRELY